MTIKALSLFLVPVAGLMVGGCAVEPAGPGYYGGPGYGDHATIYVEGRGYRHWNGSGYYYDQDRGDYRGDRTENDVNINRTNVNERTVNETNVNERNVNRTDVNDRTVNRRNVNKGAGKNLKGQQKHGERKDDKRPDQQ